LSSENKTLENPYINVDTLSTFLFIYLLLRINISSLWWICHIRNYLLLFVLCPSSISNWNLLLVN